MKSIIKNNFFLILFIISCFNFNLFSQNFRRIETIANLSGLSENNGVAVADYDGDNDLDLFVVAKAIDNNGDDFSHSKLFKNNNDGTFQDVTLESGLMDLYPFDEDDIEGGFEGFKFGASWGDYDNDGFPDLFLTNAYRIQLFHNEGNETFIEKTTEAGFIERNGCNNTSATWFDFDNDGFLDIYIGDWAYCDGNSLYKNNGDGTFQNVTNQFGAAGNLFKTYLGMPVDANSDGFIDLYTSNDAFTPNSLLINNNGTSFIEQGESYKVDNDGNGMGLTIGDYNNDGLFDIFVTNIGRNALLTNNGDNTYLDLAQDQNVLQTGWAWDTRFSDFDLDGDEDLFVVNGYRGGDNNYYFKNLFVEGGNSFSDISEQVNFNDYTTSLGAEVFDYDNDGDLDIFLANVNKSAYFYENKLIDQNQSEVLHWFKMSLVGTISNRDAIGTTVSVTTDISTIYRYYTGVGLMSQSLQPIHFGLGSASKILEIKIKWPSGLVEVHENLLVDTTIKATESNGYEVLDINPSSKVHGCTDPNSCNYNPNALVDDGSCTYLESYQISGEINSGFLKTESYTYPLIEGNRADWKVEGGEILTGQGSNSITVKWGLEPNGKISLIESDECSSSIVELDVNLDISVTLQDQSVARIWNEALLESIRRDFARPTVHARNLFHVSVAMYDSWAIYDNDARPYLIGNQMGNYTSTFNGFTSSSSNSEARNETISYAAYRLLSHRFKKSPNVSSSKEIYDLLMNQMGYDKDYTSTDYRSGDAAALGNYIAESIINYGLSDGSREADQYNNSYYLPLNDPLTPIKPGNENLTDPNRWQPLSLDVFIDQSGNLIEGSTPEFLSPEWGNVSPFSLKENVKVTYHRDGHDYNVYHDPSAPPKLGSLVSSVENEAYKWGFSLVSIWGSHLDPFDNVYWDISPKSAGNIDIGLLPKNYEDYPSFYNLFEGGDIGKGHDVNPFTNSPYQEQNVPRADYARVLAEFWADGPESETPPGHWFTLLNYVNDHELFEKRLEGVGTILESLEWDVKSYFILGGAMHDAAIAAWSIKGWYDYVRPISAIRYMSDNGQSSDSSEENFSEVGFPLKEGYIEIVKEGDPIAGNDGEHIGKIKLFTWRGHNYIHDADVDQAGVGWILAENWWPYQRPTFVTPPFAGFVSGHSTFSRAAAEVLTLLTGDEYFPGGYGEFLARKNEFLVFEEGPSVDVKLQWATYRDASDQCSLSRIWGGIHPPVDDIPGRLIGEQIGKDAFSFGLDYFSGKVEGELVNQLDYLVYPNPISSGQVSVLNTLVSDSFGLVDMKGSAIPIISQQYDPLTKITSIKYSSNISAGVYILKINNESRLLLKL